jgi:hypothetical protein
MLKNRLSLKTPFSGVIGGILSYTLVVLIKRCVAYSIGKVG